MPSFASAICCSAAWWARTPLRVTAFRSAVVSVRTPAVDDGVATAAPTTIDAAARASSLDLPSTGFLLLRSPPGDLGIEARNQDILRRHPEVVQDHPGFTDLPGGGKGAIPAVPPGRARPLPGSHRPTRSP